MAEQKKIKWKLNLFDLLVVAAVLIAAVIVVGSRYQQRQAAQADQTEQTAASGRVTVRYVVELTEMLEQAAQLVQPGDELVERTRKESMGTVESVEITQTQNLTKDQLTGEYHLVPVPERYTATMVITATGTESDSSIVLDNTSLEIRAGTSVRVYGPGYYGTGYIISVERG